MKTKETTKKKFDAVKMMRDIRDKIDKETEGMSFEQLKEYYSKSLEEAKKKAGRQHQIETNGLTHSIATSLRTHRQSFAGN